MNSRRFLISLSFIFAGCSSLESFDSVPQHRAVVSDSGIVQIKKFDHMCVKTKFTTGTRLLGLIDNRCAAKQSKGLSSEIRNQSTNTTELRLQAYSWTVNKDVDIDELNRRAHEDECVLHLGEDFEVRAIQIAPPEPITATRTSEPEPPMTEERTPASVPEPPAETEATAVPEPPRSPDAVATVSEEDLAEKKEIPDDPSYKDQWGMKAIEASQASEIFFGPQGITSDVTIAVIDTGIDYDHPDLKANMYVNSEGKHGINLIAGNKDPKDDNGHGTHVAGIAAATWNNGVGIAGVMGRHGKLMAVKALDENGSGRTSTIINGIQYAVENGASVINLSLGMRGHSTAMQNAIADAVRAGTTVVMAAGNDSAQLGPDHVESPAIYGGKIDGAMTVGALDATLSRSQYSNFGPDYVELAAPGSKIFSTVKNGEYETLSGTSMAAPHVAGAAGLAIGYLRSRTIQPNPPAIEAILKEGSFHDNTLYTYFENGNRLHLTTLAKVLETRYPSKTNLADNPEVLPAPTIKNECGSMKGTACEVFKAVNRERVKYNLDPLEPLHNCVSLAESHARSMAVGQFFSHRCPVTGNFETRASTFGLAGSASENLGFGYATAEQLVEAWMNSEDAKKKILSTEFKSSGVAISIDEFNQPFFDQCFSSMTGK